MQPQLPFSFPEVYKINPDERSWSDWSKMYMDESLSEEEFLEAIQDGLIYDDQEEESQIMDLAYTIIFMNLVGIKRPDVYRYLLEHRPTTQDSFDVLIEIIRTGLPIPNHN